MEHGKEFQTEIFGTLQHIYGNRKQMSNTNYEMISLSYVHTYTVARGCVCDLFQYLASVKKNRGHILLSVEVYAPDPIDL